jgi:acetolactate synthase regulatory subunit
MGLIGTFIGLMEMVASVGGIIGGLNEAGTGSEDAIKNVLRDLQAPLTGMATGFSASLFGLFGSLSLGLIARFGTTAANAIKREFEAWLSRISNLEAQGTGSASGAATVDGTTVAIAGSLLGAFRTTQGLITRSAEVMKRLGERQETQTEVLAKLVEQVEGLSIRQGHTITQLKRVDMIGDALDGMREEAILRDRAASNRLAEGVGRVSQVIENSRIDLFDAVQNVAEQVRGTERLGRVLELQQNRGFEAIALELSTIAAAGNERGRIYAEHHSEVEKLIRTSLRPLDVGTVSDQLAASVDERLAAGFGAVAASFDESLNRLVSGLDRLGQTQAELADRLLAVDAATTTAEEMRAFGKNIEQGVASGLAEIAKVLEGVLSDRSRQIREEVDAAAKTDANDDAIADSFELNKIVVEAVLDRFRKKSKNIRSAS